MKSITKNFRKVVKQQDARLIEDLLYRFLTLHCGFPSFQNISQFRKHYYYSVPFQAFASVFDPFHTLYCPIFPSDHQTLFEGRPVNTFKAKFSTIVLLNKHNFHFCRPALWLLSVDKEGLQLSGPFEHEGQRRNATKLYKKPGRELFKVDSSGYVSIQQIGEEDG